MAIIFETSLGQFTIDLFCEERPKCCENFLKLCKVKYFNFCLFHSIQTNLVAQTGDPTGSGKGGYSIWQQVGGEKYFQNELKPKIKHRKAGLISMVNNGQNKHGSQFFITLADNLDYLDGKHTVFGEISEGREIIEKLNKVFIDRNNVPLRDVMIYHTIILHDPFPDHPNLIIPECSPEPTETQITSKRIGAEEEIEDNSGLTEEERREVEKIKEAQVNAQILAVIGDIPDENIKPPENVLFVCSLNPITTSDDLEIIFSRFGNILSCEVIRDYKTGNSLQYAFIEFEHKKSCEEAYFNMERVLIDDRRIHVDFSQSVAKEWRTYRQQLRDRNLARDKPVEITAAKRTEKKTDRRNKERSHDKYRHQNRSDDRRQRSRSRVKYSNNRGGDEERYRNRSDKSRDRHKSRRKRSHSLDNRKRK